MSKSILITGATGFLGSHLCAHLHIKGFKIHALIRHHKNIQHQRVLSFYGLTTKDIEYYFIEDISFFKDILETFEGDIVIHCMGAIFGSKKHLYQTNVLGTEEVAQACLQYQKKLIYIGSIASLGHSESNQPISLNSLWQKEQGTEYGTSKMLARLVVKKYQYEGLNAIILHPAVILGEGFPNSGSNLLIKYCFNKIIFYPKGGVLAWVSVSDVCLFVEKTLTFDNLDEYIIVGQEIFYLDFFKAVVNYYKLTKKFIALPYRVLFILTTFWFPFRFLGIGRFFSKRNIKSLYSKSTYDISKIDTLILKYDTLKEVLESIKVFTKDN